jgi:hypothetical protein
MKYTVLYSELRVQDHVTLDFKDQSQNLNDTNYSYNKMFHNLNRHPTIVNNF